MNKTEMRIKRRAEKEAKENNSYGRASTREEDFPFGRTRFRSCKECSIPLAISRNHLWEENGIILSRDGSQRLVIVERKILDGIIRETAKRMGDEADRIMLYAKAFDASRYVRSLMSGWKKTSLGYPALKKPLYEMLCDQVRILGMADARVASYTRGEELVIACTECYNKTFMAGDILGAVYECEGREAAVEVEEAGGEVIFKATVLENKRCEEIEKYRLSKEAPIPGHVNYRRCRKCGMPFAVSFMSWDIPRGIMVDTRNGEPVALINVAGINASYETVRDAQGEAVDQFLAIQVKKMVDSILPGLTWKHRKPEDRIRDLFFLAYRGMGNPVFTEPINDGIRARVENPFNYPLVAGIAASFLARGKTASFEWERSMPGRLELYLYFE